MNTDDDPTEFEVVVADPDNSDDEPTLTFTVPGSQGAAVLRGLRSAALGDSLSAALDDHVEKVAAVVREVASETLMAISGHGRKDGDGDTALTDEAKEGVRVLEAIGKSLGAENGKEPPPQDQRPRYMKPGQYADYKQVSKSTVYRWLKLGMPHQSLGPKLVRIRVEDAEAWHEAGGPKKAVQRSATIHSRTKGRS